MQQLSVFDTQEASREALKVAPVASDRQAVLNLFGKHPHLTLGIACRILGKQKNELSGRFTELKAKGLIEVIGKSNDKPAQSVYRIVPQQMKLND